MRKFPRMQVMVLAALVLVLIASIAQAAVRKEYILLTTDATATASSTVTINQPGMIRLARVDTETTGTLTLTSINGPDTVTLATQTISATGVSTASSLANLPIAGDVQLSLTASSADADNSRATKIVLLIEE